MIASYVKYKENCIHFVKLPLIDGNYRSVAVKNIAGTCHNNIHKGYLDIKLLQQHDCINKKCPFLEKFEDYPFWVNQANIAREKAKKCREYVKAHEKSEKIKVLSAERMNILFESAQGIANRLEYPIIITRVAPKRSSSNNYEYIINYVSDLRTDDWHEYFDLALLMGKCHGGKYTLKHMRFPNGDYVTTYDWLKFNQK